jgi:hypothetical protein
MDVRPNRVNIRPTRLSGYRRFMRLAAITTGYAIPQADFDASLHSVFRTAANLRLANQDLLLTLVSANQADLPQGMRIASPGDFTFEQLSTGAHATCRDGILSFEGSALEVDLNRANRWQCDLPALRTDLADPAVAAAWRFTWQLLNQRQANQAAEIVAEHLLHPEHSTAFPISRRIGQALGEIMMAMRNHRVHDLSALTHIIGLGSGLTPSGDDFLVGFLAGLWCGVQDSAKRLQWVTQLGQAIAHLSCRTNDISHTYLQHAAHGQVSSRLQGLARAISSAASPGEIVPLAELAMRTGYTSGMDAVTGLLFGLAAWDGELTPLAR